jgi:hypothetical protein
MYGCWYICIYFNTNGLLLGIWLKQVIRNATVEFIHKCLQQWKPRDSISVKKLIMDQKHYTVSTKYKH